MKPDHQCHYEWVNCVKCLPDNSKPRLHGERKGPGMDQYGNQCHHCHGLGKVALCATCEMERRRHHEEENQCQG